MVAKTFSAEVNIEIIKIAPITHKIERNRITFKGLDLTQARIQAKTAMGDPKGYDPEVSGFVVIGNDQIEFWVKGLELVHD